ncbi:MAG: hypothetical protein KDD04_06870, partial [Sinomicrobium sp.]|nr:hypothetical protein [Sinomicrobium sp.]
NVNFHAIWSKGDLAATPIQTAVMEGAHNYFIDTLSVNHLGILKHSVTIDIIRDVISGNPRAVNGLQHYPPTTGCSAGSGRHQWIPLWANDADTQKFEKFYIWKCENELDGKKCTKEDLSIWRPALKGCEVGHIEQQWRWHTWKKTNQKWQCLKCDSVRTQNEKPGNKGKCKWPNPGYHRWRLKEQLWKCNNCQAEEWEPWRFKPPVLGCPDGIINDRMHSWFKAEKRYRFRFRCAGCGKKAAYDGYHVYQ